MILIICFKAKKRDLFSEFDIIVSDSLRNFKNLLLKLVAVVQVNLSCYRETICFIGLKTDIHKKLYSTRKTLKENFLINFMKNEKISSSPEQIRDAMASSFEKICDYAGENILKQISQIVQSQPYDCAVIDKNYPRSIIRAIFKETRALNTLEMRLDEDNLNEHFNHKWTQWMKDKGIVMIEEYPRFLSIAFEAELIKIFENSKQSLDLLQNMSHPLYDPTKFSYVWCSVVPNKTDLHVSLPWSLFEKMSGTKTNCESSCLALAESELISLIRRVQHLLVQPYEFGFSKFLARRIVCMLNEFFQIRFEIESKQFLFANEFRVRFMTHICNCCADVFRLCFDILCDDHRVEAIYSLFEKTAHLYIRQIFQTILFPDKI